MSLPSFPRWLTIIRVPKNLSTATGKKPREIRIARLSFHLRPKQNGAQFSYDQIESYSLHICVGELRFTPSTFQAEGP